MYRDTPFVWERREGVGGGGWKCILFIYDFFFLFFFFCLVGLPWRVFIQDSRQLVNLVLNSFLAVALLYLQHNYTFLLTFFFFLI